MQYIIENLWSIPDTPKDRTKKNTFIDILFNTMLAILCECNEWEEIGYYGEKSGLVSVKIDGKRLQGSGNNSKEAIIDMG